MSSLTLSSSTTLEKRSESSPVKLASMTSLSSGERSGRIGERERKFEDVGTTGSGSAGAAESLLLRLGAEAACGRREEAMRMATVNDGKRSFDVVNIPAR
jgi:hypothetical protein